MKRSDPIGFIFICCYLLVISQKRWAKNIKKLTYNNMALYRENPRCPECGVAIEGKYWKPAHGIGFAGDTFEGWDWHSHVCRLGIKYFIERTDENKWWTGSNWTNDPIDAMLWKSESEAKKYLTDTMLIALRIPCEVTEHEFFSMQEGREK